MALMLFLKQRIYLILSGLLVLSTLTVDAQGPMFGGRLGFNIGTPIGKADSGATGAPGLGLMWGLTGGYQINDDFSISVGAYFSQKNSKFSTPIEGDTIWPFIVPATGDTVYFPAQFKGVVDGKFANIYLDFPILASYHFGNGFRVEVGPQFSFMIVGNNTGLADIEVGDGFDYREDEPFDESYGLRRYDFAVVGGVGYKSEVGLDIALRISTALNSIYRSDYTQVSTPVRNVYAQLSVGFILDGSKKEK